VLLTWIQSRCHHKCHDEAAQSRPLPVLLSTREMSTKASLIDHPPEPQVKSLHWSQTAVFSRVLAPPVRHQSVRVVSVTWIECGKVNSQSWCLVSSKLSEPREKDKRSNNKRTLTGAQMDEHFLHSSDRVPQARRPEDPNKWWLKTLFKLFID
jgi:hypothetical protein